MCIVVDANIFNEVLTRDPSFKPLSDWIYKGDAKFVIGGTKYKHEIGFNKHERKITYFKNLKDASKLVLIPDGDVDKEEAKLKSILDKDCDDQHIIALIKISGVKLLASRDKRSVEHVKKQAKVKIYSSEANSNLLNSKNIAECCKTNKKR